jgi:hypothetical protein
MNDFNTNLSRVQGDLSKWSEITQKQDAGESNQGYYIVNAAWSAWSYVSPLVNYWGSEPQSNWQERFSKDPINTVTAIKSIAEKTIEDLNPLVNSAEGESTENLQAALNVLEKLRMSLIESNIKLNEWKVISTDQGLKQKLSEEQDEITNLMIKQVGGYISHLGKVHHSSIQKLESISNASEIRREQIVDDDNTLKTIRGMLCDNELSFTEKIEISPGRVVNIPEQFKKDLLRNRSFTVQNQLGFSSEREWETTLEDCYGLMVERFGEKGAEALGRIVNQALAVDLLSKVIVDDFTRSLNSPSNVSVPLEPRGFKGENFRHHIYREEDLVRIETRLCLLRLTDEADVYDGGYVVKREIAVPLEELVEAVKIPEGTELPGLHVTDTFSEFIHSPEYAKILTETF